MATLVITAGTFALAYPVNAALIDFGVKERMKNPAEMGQSQGTGQAQAVG